MKHNQSLKVDLLHLAVLTGIATAIGTYLIVTCVIIPRDGVFYIDQAKQFAHNPLAVARRYPVGYPAMLFWAHKAMGLSDSAMAWIYSSQGVTLLTRVLALIPLYLTGKRLVGARRSFLALLILIILPNLASYGSEVLREWPFILFLSLSFWLLITALQAKRWWLFGLVGLSAGLGYLIRPMCGQILLYGLIGLAIAYRSKGLGGPLRFVGVGLLMMTGFAIPVVPCLAWTGTVMPPQVKPSPVNGAPTIFSVGGQSARHDPLVFEVLEGQELELKIAASDSDSDALMLSVVTTPTGTRPVHRFRSVDNDAYFWTISSDQKDRLLETYGTRQWDYDGIAYYAYPKSDLATGLKPVYQFWSPGANQHFYTIEESPHESIPGDPNAWLPENIAFYAFPQGAKPLNAMPIYRLRGQDGRYSWTSQNSTDSEGIAWYVQTATAPPTGVTFQGQTLHWRPKPNQRGTYQLNIIASDGKLLSCQLVQINVKPAPLESRGDIRPSNKIPVSRASLLLADQETTILRAPQVIVEIFKTIGHSLRVFFFLPLCLGFYHRFKHQADRFERALMIAIVAVNVVLISFRSLWIHPTIARRYCLALIVLTIFYIPIGLELMAGWLKRYIPQTSRWSWLHILAMIGIAICTPRLLKPIGIDGQGYRQVAQWLRENTESHQIVAVPELRISFYAEREGLLYQRYPDPRRADYVIVLEKESIFDNIPEGWRERYSSRTGRKRDKRLVVYEIQ